MSGFIHEGWVMGWPERLGLIGTGLVIIGVALILSGFVARVWIDA